MRMLEGLLILALRKAPIFLNKYLEAWFWKFIS